MSEKLINSLKRKRSIVEIQPQSKMIVTNFKSNPQPKVNHQVEYQLNEKELHQANSYKKKPKMSDDTETHRQMDFLLEALLRVRDLEKEMSEQENSTDEDENEAESTVEGRSTDTSIFEKNALEFEAEALGFAMCARETLNFLVSEGLSPNDPLVQSLRAKLVG